MSYFGRASASATIIAVPPLNSTLRFYEVIPYADIDRALQF